jgi:hypothetical protein
MNRTQTHSETRGHACGLYRSRTQRREGNGFNLIVRLDRRLKQQTVGAATPFEPPLNLLVRPGNPSLLPFDGAECSRTHGFLPRVQGKAGKETYRFHTAPRRLGRSDSQEQLLSNLIVVSTVLVLHASVQHRNSDSHLALYR